MRTLRYITAILVFCSAATVWAQGIQLNSLARSFDFDIAALTPESESAVNAYVERVNKIIQQKKTLFHDSRSAAATLAEVEAGLRTFPNKKELAAIEARAQAEVSPRDTLYLPDEDGLNLVTEMLKFNREQMASAAKFLTMRNEHAAAKCVIDFLQKHEARYPYTKLCTAYYSLYEANLSAAKYGTQDPTIYAAELSRAADQFRSLAHTARKDVNLRRKLNIIAGELSYMANDDQLGREFLGRALADSPSIEDSADIYVMLSQFERTDAALAMKDSDNVRALECYDRAIEYLGEYLNSGRTLPHDKYTSSAIEDYLFCNSNRAYLLKTQEDDMSGYDQLLAETNRFLDYRSDDIRTHRYKLTYYFNTAGQDTLVFPRYAEEFRESAKYVTDNMFADSLYTYSDYNMVQRYAGMAKDTVLWARYTEKSIRAFDEKTGDIKDKNDLYQNIVFLYQNGLKDPKGEVAWRKEWNKWRFDLAQTDTLSTFDFSVPEIALAQTYFRQIYSQDELKSHEQPLTMSADEIKETGEEAMAILNKYVNVEDEEKANAVRQTRQNLSMAMIRVSNNYEDRMKYFNEQYEDLRAKLDEKKEQFDLFDAPGEFKRLFALHRTLTNACFIDNDTCTAKAVKLGLDDYIAILDKIESYDVEAYLGHKDLFYGYLGTIANFPSSSSLLECCNIVNESIRQIADKCSSDEKANQRLQISAYAFYRQLYNNFDAVAHNLKEDNKAVTHHDIRNQFIDILPYFVEKGMTYYLDGTLAGGDGQDYVLLTKITMENKNLTDTQKRICYVPIAMRDYQRWSKSDDIYYAKRTPENLQRACDDAEEAYLSISNALEYDPENERLKKYIEIFQSNKYLAETLERAEAEVQKAKAKGKKTVTTDPDEKEKEQAAEQAEAEQAAAEAEQAEKAEAENADNEEATTAPAEENAEATPADSEEKTEEQPAPAEGEGEATPAEGESTEGE